MILLTGCVLGIFDQDKDIDAEESDEDHQDVHNRPSCHNYAKLSKFKLEKFVIERVKAEVGAILHLIQAFSAPVNRCLGNTDQEWQQNEREYAKDQHGEHCQQVAENTGLILNYRVRNCITVWALYFSRSE